MRAVPMLGIVVLQASPQPVSAWRDHNTARLATATRDRRIEERVDIASKLAGRVAEPREGR
jgi:hypothetical protein